MSSAIAELDIPSGRKEPRLSLKPWMHWAGKGTLAVLDQGLFAGGNFVANIMLARALPPTEYGAFALAFSTLLLVASFHTALITEPMMVYGAGKYAPHLGKYLQTLIPIHFLLTLPVGVLLAGIGYLTGTFYGACVQQTFLGMAAATPFILLLWLVRRAFYARLQPAWAAVGGGLYLLFLPSCIYALRGTRGLSAATGLFCMAVASLVVSGLLLVPLNAFKPSVHTTPTVSMVAADHWRYGRWAIATAALGWLPSNIYFVLLPAWIGLEQAGALKAMNNLAMPVLLGISGLSLLCLPILSRQFALGGKQAMNKTIWLSLGLFFLPSVLYLSLLWGLRGAIFQLLYKGKYHELAGWPLVLVGLLPFGQAITVIFGNALRALQRPDHVFWSSAAGIAATLLLGLPLAWRHGVGGALAGSLAAFIATGGSMLFFYGRSQQKCEK